jgi:hypothetical protein
MKKVQVLNPQKVAEEAMEITKYASIFLIFKEKRFITEDIGIGRRKKRI